MYAWFFRLDGLPRNNWNHRKGKSVKTTRCIDCDGEGTLETERACPDPIRGGELVGVVVECWYCDGTGEITDYYAEEDDLDG